MLYNIFEVIIMRYDTTISYQGKQIKIKVTNKEYCGDYELPDFLKAVRIAKKHDFNDICNTTKQWLPHQCKAFENGTEPISWNYLVFFSLCYLLPVKLRTLGVTDTQKKESPLALRIRELRLKAGYSQEKCATEINVARSTYAGYEVGRNVPDIETLVKIANVYGVSLDYLVDRKYT
jgi:DNA-binding XRE family transcriptional regulator